MRLIDADALKVSLTELGWTSDNGFDKRMYIDDIIDNSPTVEAYTFEQVQDLVALNKKLSEERPHGEWRDFSDDGYVECPFCEHATTCDDNIEELHYCFFCGASMKKEGEAE